MIYKHALKYDKKLREIRHALHKIPELEFCEHKTTEFIENELDMLGIEHERLLDTGVVGLIKGKKGKGNTILIRADIDALPIKELNESEFKSQNEGVMHACGHDAHITCLLGMAYILKDMDYNFYGNIKMVFQPAEEGQGGALPLIKNGVMENPKVDACIALHVDPSCDVGVIKLKNDAIMASPDDFYLKIVGVGGHGANPQECINPIYIASELALIIEKEFFNHKNCIVSVCTINGGTKNNIIPNYVEITGTARSLNEETRLFIKTKIDELAKKMCKKYNSNYEYQFNFLYPPVINDENMNNLVINSAKELSCFKDVIMQEEPSMTGDDFSYFANLVPSSYFKLGTKNKSINYPLHSPRFDIDEDCLVLGAAIMAKASLDYLEKNK